MIEVSLPTPVPQTLSLPRTLNGRYAIERELGSGGATGVFLARDLQQQRQVVVRLLRRDAGREEDADRFLAYVQKVAGLQHPNIVQVLDSGTVRGATRIDAAYCVTPFVAGGSLRQRIEREKQMPLDEALRIVGRIAAALDYAQRQGVVHGNLAPQSILLPDGDVLVDYTSGLWASPARSAGDPWVADTAARVAYISPERALSDIRLGPETDQYSLAAILYAMLAGEPPFSGTPAQVMNLVVEGAPRRLTTLRVVPRLVERAVYRGLSRLPAERFRSAGEFAAALEGVSGAPPTSTPLPKATSRRRWRVPVITALVVLVTGVGVAMASRAVVNRRAPAAAAHSQVTFSANATSPALSPDGQSVVYVAGGRALVAHSLDRGEVDTIVRGASSIEAARWTADGRSVVVAMTRDSSERPATFIVAAACPATGGQCAPPRKVLDDARPFDTGADPALIIRAAREPRRLEIVSLASGKAVQTLVLPDSIGPIAEVAWSPDQRWVAFSDGTSGALWVVATAGGSPRRVASTARRARWSAESNALYYLGGRAGAIDLMRVSFDPSAGLPAGNAQRVTSLLAADNFDIGRDGRLVHTQISRGPQAVTFVIGARAPRAPVEQNPLSVASTPIDGAVISPDGRWVAYSTGQGLARDVHVVAVGGGSARVLAGGSEREAAPSWSADGARLTYAQEDSAGRRVMSADARTGIAQRVGSLAGPGGQRGATQARWSASGRHIAYYADDLQRIALVNLQRRNESMVRVPEYVGRGHVGVIPSPNGTQLLAITRDTTEDRPLVWLVFGNGRRWRQIRGPAGEWVPIAWHRNGWIYLVRNRAVATGHGAAHVELWRMRGPTGRAERYATLPEGCGMSVSISSDATRGVCDYVRVESDLYVASSVGETSR
jgi:serine/threonine-protein kinase